MKHIDGKFPNKILRVTTSRKLFANRRDLALLTKRILPIDIGYGVIITTSCSKKSNVITLSKDDYCKFSDKDIIETNEKGIDFLWEYNNNDNCFFLTDMCSCNCIMCPQPPKPHNKDYEFKAHKILQLIPLSYKNSICITGGEPTLLKDFYLDLMARIRKKFPSNFLITLTNGKSFSDLDFLNKFHQLNLNSVVAISICADVDVIHDGIVRAKGSFNQTQQGIYNLAKANEQIELRFVISRLNYKRLPQFAEFVYRNFPFIVHVALMGMEYTGYASDNFDAININPTEYSLFLKDATQKLNRYGMFISIYNIPLCLLDKSIRKFASQSISKWKNDYCNTCLECGVKDKCGGVFTTSSKHPYTNLSPITDM